MSDEELFEKYYRDALSAGELDELKRLLRESAETRQAFARFTEERSILVHLTGRSAGMEERGLPELSTPRRRAPVALARRPRNPFVIVAGVAAVALLLVSILLTLPSTSNPVTSKKPVKPPVVTPEPQPEIPKPLPPPPTPEPPKPQPVPEEPPKKPEPKPVEPTPPTKPEEPKKPPVVEPPKRETVVEKAIATLEKADGGVLRVAGTAKTAIKAGETLLPGQGLEAAGVKSTATFAYPDGTRVRLEGETIVLHLQAEGGKRFSVQQGAVAADVPPQPAGQPLTIYSSHAQAAVLGTALRFAVASSGTRVEVRQGKVQLTRTSDSKSVLLQADQAAEVLDSPNGNDGAWTKYSRKVDTGASTQITVAYKTGTRSPSGPTVGFDQLRLATGGADDFEAMPRWDSAFDAAWGGAAIWTIEAGGQTGRFLQAARPGPGSSVKAKVFTVPPRSTIDVSAYLKCPSGSPAEYWMEFGYRLGNHPAQDFDVNAAAWTIIKKFDSSPGGEIEVKALSPPKK